FLCIHDDVDNLIESTLDSKLLSSNSINSQHLDKKEQEVKNVVEQPAERRNPEEFKIYPNPLCDEDEINSDQLDPNCFNVKSDFVESLLNRGSFIDFSSKFDFSGELAHINLEIPKSDFDFEEEIRLIENLVYDNSFPRPPEELNAKIADTIIESIPLLPIPVQDEPPDDNFDLKPEVISEVMEDIDEPDEHFNPGGEIFVSTNIKDVDYIPFMFVIRIFLPYLILSEISPLLLSAESEDTIFDPGISK
nr:hypothetical protein [Tanacetum cinerariifolium]